ncbi:MAG TPA: PRC-barrel domain-containing protein [Burkholderiales bacterium]|nr:PRC-barrel domain-containing protein [Burkholderiales bacterium]
MDRREIPLSQRSAKHLQGGRVQARDGVAGSVRDVYFDDRTWDVRYLVVATGGWRGKRVLVRPEAVDRRASEAGLRLAITRSDVAHAPDAESDRPVARQLALERAVRLGYPYYWSGLGLWGAVGGGSRDQAEHAAYALLGHGDPHLRSAAELLGSTVRTRAQALGRLVDLELHERAWTIDRLVIDTHFWRPGGRLRLSPAFIERIDCLEHCLYLTGGEQV